MLPGLRLFTLEAREAARLPKFLTDKEDAELLRFFITEEMGADMPEKLNTSIVKRHQVNDIVQILNDRRARDSPLHYKCNELLLTTNVDILITQFSVAHNCENCFKFYELFVFNSCSKAIIYIEDDDVDFVEIEADLRPIDSNTYKLKCVNPILVKKNEPMRLIVARYDYNTKNQEPWSTLDLDHFSRPAKKNFHRIQFKEASNDKTKTFLASFSHRMV